MVLGVGKARALALTLCATLGAASACVPEPPPPQVSELRVIAVPETTTVYNQGHFLGTARLLAKRPKSMRPGLKYLTFKAPGYFPHDLRLSLPAGESTVRIKLRPIPP